VVTVLERRLDKMILRAPADCVVSIIAAALGENVRAGQPVLIVEAPGEQWLSFNAPRDQSRRHRPAAARRVRTWQAG
jgi:HlyD family secretion protein